MTTGRINQVRTIGGARPKARPHAGPPGASSAGTRPQPGPGGFGCPGASPRASEERASGRPGGRAAHAGCPPRALVRQPPTCAALSLGPVQAASDAWAPSTSAGQSRAPARAGLRWSLTPADSVPSTSAGQSRAPAHARRRRSPNRCGGRAVDLGRPDTLADRGQPGAARAAPVRRGVTAAISNWPAAPAAGQPKQARAPVAGGLAPFSHYF